MSSTHVYALIYKPANVYILSAGYYGNEANIRCFITKEAGKQYIETYCTKGQYKLKRMRVK